MGADIDALYIKELRVDKGVTMKRMMPAAMGSGHRINKRTSNVAVLLAEKAIPIKGSNSKKLKDNKRLAPKA